MIWASRNRFSQIVNHLIANGADANVANNKGYIALMWDSKFGRAQPVEFLIETGVDINARGRNGDTALILASKKGQTQISKTLNCKRS